MENRSYALMTGVFTIALVVAAVLLGLWFNRDRTEMLPYEIVTTQSIPGLNPQATVRYRGLEVGRVDAIVFDPRVTGQILIKLSIERDAPVTTTTFATLGYQGVTGIAFVQLDDNHVGSPRLSKVTDLPARIPLRPGLLDILEKRGLAILKQTEQITDSLSEMVSGENRQTIIGAFDSIGKAADAYAAIPRKLEPAIERLPELTAKLDRSLDTFDATATSIQTTADSYGQLATTLQAPDGPLERINSAIGSLQSATSQLERQTLPNVVELTDEARGALRAVKRTADSLSDRPQSILFGAPSDQPGPGEAGFVPPTK